MLDQSQPQPITSQLLDAATGGTPIRHGFFTRAGGISDDIYAGLNVGLGSRDDLRRVAENRERVCRWFSATGTRLVTPHQVHSPNVHVAFGPIEGERPKADAVVTAVPGLVVGVLTADCGPILLADAEAGVVAAAHAGWRGAFDGIVENTVAAMESLGADRARIAACLGPSISRRNYEVGPEFVARFIGRDAGLERFFEPSARRGHAMFDLPAYTLERLAAAGIEAENLDLCTYSDEERFFSYRRTTHRSEPDYGRQISAISIMEQ